MVFQIVIKNNVMKNTKNLKSRDQELKMTILLKIMTVTDIVKTTPTIVIDIGKMTDTEAIVEIIHKTIIDLIPSII